MLKPSIPALLLALSFVVSTPLHAGNKTLSATEAADLQFMREEEKMARDVYLMLYDIWELGVFSNISSSEQNHMDAILRLLRTYGLVDPAAGTLIGEFANPELQAFYSSLLEKGRLSKLDALQAGGIIEEADIRDLAGAIDRSEKTNIDTTYDSLLCGSRNHLRAFARNLESMTGQHYVAQVIAQEEVDVILSSPMERCSQRQARGGN